MPFTRDVTQNEQDKFVESTSVPGQPGLVVLSPDGSNISGGGGGGSGTEYTEDAAAAANPVGPMSMARRKDTLATDEVSADGDNIALNATSKGELHVKHADAIAVTNSGLTELAAAIDTEVQVDVVGSLPAGDNNIGNVDIASSALPTGASTAANQTTMIGHLDGVEALLTTIDADTGNIDTSLNDIETALEEEWDTFRSLDLDESEEEVKATAGKIGGWFIFNAATSIRYIKFYNATAANVTVGTTTPKLTIPIPAQSSGGVAANVLSQKGINFSTAITVAATTGLADNDTGAPAANDVIVNIFYK